MLTVSVGRSEGRQKGFNNIQLICIMPGEMFAAQIAKPSRHHLVILCTSRAGVAGCGLALRTGET